MERDLITEWIVSDDGSNEEEFERMKKLYPFIRFLRSPKKGQPANLNFLLSQVKTEWFFHMEDDWLFVKKDNFIRKLFDVIFEEPTVKNVILRHWQPFNERLLKETKTGVKYVIHFFDPLADTAKKAVTDSAWYGYSFNPGIQNIEIIRKLGRFDESHNPASRWWDKENARYYLELGFKRASLYDGPYIEHIGELESLYSISRKECQRKNNCKKYPSGCELCGG